MKNTLSFLLSAVLLTSALPAAYAAEATPDDAVLLCRDALIGDADGDGILSIQDATMLQLMLSKGSADIPPNFDADGDGELTIADATAVQRFCARLDGCGNAGKKLDEIDIPIPLRTLAFSESEIKLGAGEVFQTELRSDGATDGAVFSSEDPSVAKIGDTGVVTAVSSGETVVSCDCGGLRAQCRVKVCPAASSLTLNQSSLTLGTGERFDLDSYVNSGAAAYFRAYSSGDPSVASVAEAGGMVTALSPGSAEILCTLQNGVRARCAVTVKPYAPSLTLNADSVTLDVGQRFDFDSYVPAGTAAYYREYHSENSAVASIAEAGGLLTANAAGSTRIYCQLQSGTRVYADVTVENGIRNRVLGFLQEQLGNSNRPYVAYYNTHAGGKKVSYSFAWCAEFAWCSLDQCAAILGRRNPVTPCCHVSEIANQARRKGALKNAFTSGYVPKKGDLFTTATVKSPGTSGRSHIGFIESVETDSSGKVTKVHTIEGNYNWENQASANTRVSRSVWTIGQRRYGALLCEYIDIEKLLE